MNHSLNGSGILLKQEDIKFERELEIRFFIASPSPSTMTTLSCWSCSHDNQRELISLKDRPSFRLKSAKLRACLRFFWMTITITSSWSTGEMGMIGLGQCR